MSTATSPADVLDAIAATFGMTRAEIETPAPSRAHTTHLAARRVAYRLIKEQCWWLSWAAVADLMGVQGATNVRRAAELADPWLLKNCRKTLTKTEVEAET